jgi:hypothetical protein
MRSETIRSPTRFRRLLTGRPSHFAVKGRLTGVWRDFRQLEVHLRASSPDAACNRSRERSVWRRLAVREGFEPSVGL